MPRFLNEQGLTKLMAFLEAKVPGISKVISVDGNVLVIGEQIGLHAEVMQTITEESPIELSDAKPLMPGQMAQDLMKTPSIANKTNLNKPAPQQPVKPDPQINQLGNQIQDLTKALAVNQNKAPEMQRKEAAQKDAAGLGDLLGDVGAGLKL